MIDFKKIYDQNRLENDLIANYGRPFQRCSQSVMDTIGDPDIIFDKDGISNYYYEYLEAEQKHIIKGESGHFKLKKEIERIKRLSKNKKYDCILGLSGGVDSTYLCLLAKEQGLNPLIVHFDNGWNSELAQHNIENTVKILGFDLYTYVVVWEHFKELQLSYLKASVVDIEVLTDHAFKAVLYTQARKWNIKFILAGMNIVTEQIMPKYWVYNKLDTVNIKSIQRKFGNSDIKKLDSYPFLDYSTQKYCDDVLKLELITPLNFINYDYKSVKKIIISELNWRDYGGKHYESIWTRFFQGYILPRKFNIDKRKAHFSNLIFSGQMSRKMAMKLLSKPTYVDLSLLTEDLNYVLKKFKLNIEEFEEIMNLDRIEHKSYSYQQAFFEKYPFFAILKPLYKWMKK